MDIKTRYKAICHSYYLLFGMVGIGILPGLLKSFEDTYNFSHSQMGILLGIGSALFAVSALLAGFFFDRYGARSILSWTMAFCAFSALSIWAASTTMAFVIAFLLFQLSNGLGSVVNPLVGQLYDKERTRGINLLHGFQGVGRLLAPILIAACIGLTGQWSVVFMVSAVMFVIWFFFVFLGMKGIADFFVSPSFESFKLQKSIRYLGDYRILIGLMGFVFVSGCEMVIITWGPVFLESEGGFSKTNALFALTFNMIGYTLIRLSLGAKQHGASSRFILASIFLLLPSFFLFINVHSTFLLFLFSFLLGLSFGAYWPSLAAIIYDYVPAEHGIITGLFTVISVVGVVLWNSMVGWLGDFFSLKQALTVVPVCAISYVVIYCRLNFLKPHKCIA